MVDEAQNLDRRTLRRLFPALRLAGAIRIAFDLRKLVIAAIGLGVLQLGWLSLDRLFPRQEAMVPFVLGPDEAVEAGADSGAWERLAALHRRLSEPIRALAYPLFSLLKPGASWRAMLHALWGLLWLFAVWGILGGAIARIAVVQVAKMRQTGIAEALRFSLRSALPLIAAPCCLLLGLLFCAVFGALFGLLYRLPVVGPAISGTLLILPLAAALVMTLLAAGLAIGWPLLQAAAAAGAEGVLDALSRTFGYLNQRIGPFAAVLVLVWFEGLVGLFLVDLLVGGVIRLAHWSLGLTAPASEIAALLSDRDVSAGAVAAGAYTFWLGIVRLLAHGWIYSFYWTAAALLYLWLRHDVDGTAWDEIDPPGASSSALIGSNATASSPAQPASAAPAAG